MKAAGCDVFVNTGIPKFAAQAIKKAAEIEWKPLHVISSVGNSVGASLKPAGLENAQDLITDFYLKGLKDGLGDKVKSIVVEAAYETTDPTVDSQVIGMKAAGCDVFVNTGIPKFAAQAIKKAAEIEWKPLHVISSVGNSVGASLKPAGLENAKDLITDFYLKDPTDAQWKDDPGYKDWVAFMDQYYPEGDKTDAGNVIGPCFAQTLVQVLKQCGDELTRENVMKQATNLKNFTVPMLLPGITINTSPTDFAPIKQMQMARFDGERWQLFGPLISGAVSG